METPALEYKKILTGKYGAEEKLMYSFRDQGGREVAMRYDLTVPLARYVGANQNELAMPFKRYQIGPVWRAENPQKGRYREFTQCDIDVVGSDSILADAEVIACINAALQELGIPEVLIKINNRKLLNGFMKEAGIPTAKMAAVIRALDKLEKAGEEAVRGELAAVGIQKKAADKLFELTSQTKFEGIEGAGELAALTEALLDMNIKNFEVDFTLARGLDYYTGTIVEFVLPDARQYGSIAGGGRYDDLLGTFIDKKTPAVGCSIGIDRLIPALEEFELIKYDQIFDVLVCNLDGKLTEKYLEIAAELRAAGIKTDLYYGSAKLDRQLKYADKKNINYAVIIGSDEISKKSATIKNMKTGKQETVKQTDLIKKVELLAEELKSERTKFEFGKGKTLRSLGDISTE